jgi:hypothetical protein
MATRTTRRLLTVITEAALERDLVRDVEALGAKGYTITDARGRGSRGRRSSTWAQDGNIRLEVICDADHAERLVEHLRARYYDHYAMVLFVQDVEVLRPEKFD